MPGSAIFRAQLAAGAVNECLIIEIDHPAGYGYFWTGIGNLDYGGNIYRGLAVIGAVTEVRSTTDVEIVEVRYTLSGVDPDLLDGLDDSVKGRKAYIYEALLDDNMRVIERELSVDSECDYQVYKLADNGKATIDLVAHAGLWWLKRRSAAKWSPEQMKSIYPDESGFDEVHLQEDLQDQWRPNEA